MCRTLIVEPYGRTPFVDEISDKTDWEHEEFHYHRKDILNYLYKLNRGTCFYCKTYIPYEACVAHIEHIINKSDHEEFTYHPVNLTLACPICNSNKLKKEVLEERLVSLGRFAYNDYPLHSEDFIIIHPYLDNYDQHLFFQDGWFIKEVEGSHKGKNTIEVCNLNRYSLILQKMQLKRNNEADVRFCRDIALQLTDDVKEIQHIDDLLNGKAQDRQDDFFFINFIVSEFVQQLKRDKTHKRENAIALITSFTNTEEQYFDNIIKLIRAIQYGAITFDSLVSFLSDKNMETHIQKSIQIFDLLEGVFEKKEYRQMIRFILDQDIYKEINDYIMIEFGEKLEEIESLVILLKFKHFISFCRHFNHINIIDDIYVSRRILNDIVTHLNRKESTA